MRIVSLVVALAVPAITVGCMQDHTYMDPNANLPIMDDLGGGDALEFSGGGALHGDIGPVKGFRGQQNVTVEGYDDGVCTYVTITGVGENGSGFLYVDVMPRVDELPEGNHAIDSGELAYEGTLVTAHADTDDGSAFDATAQEGSVTMIKHADGTRELSIQAVVDDGTGNFTESIGVFKLQPAR